MIPIAEPNLTGKEKEYVADAIASGWVSGGGPYVERFEAMVAESCRKRHCIATITGTAALHAAMTMLEYEGEISMPMYTFAASRNVVKMIGAEWRVGTSDFNHDYAELVQAKPMRAQWIVDAAPAVGFIRGDADIYTLSFNGNKTITTGQGGALLCNDASLADGLRALIRQTQYAGQFNYRMPNVNAAMGCAQMERFEELWVAKCAIWGRYKGAGIPVKQAGESRWMCLLGNIDPPKEAPFEIRHLWGSPYWCLPCSTNLTREDQDKVIRCVESLQ